ncbi:MAG TPA: GGDEF domain-containing protein [Pirellulales bacterium]|nr:GGDEF domain-containing protein [Pirellulales bacterium]
MVITLLVSVVVIQGAALAAVLVYFWFCIPAPAPDEEPSDAIRSRDGLLDDYQNLLRETLTRIGMEGQSIAEIGASVADPNNDITSVLRHELTERVNGLVEANSRLRNDLASANVRLEIQCAALKRLTAESRHDWLTQLPNRRAFDERMVELYGRFQRYGEQFVMVIFDVDSFKSFNDNYGHAAGDAVLAAIAKVVSERRRSTDFVARIGGEEFAILLTHTTLKQSEQCIAGYRRAIEATTLRSNDRPLRVTASFGAAEVTTGEAAADLKHRADQALYAAKGAGRNCTRFHDGSAIVASLVEELAAT